MSTLDPDSRLYQLKYGIIPMEVPHPPKRKMKPLDLAKERMAVEAYNKISLGIGIFVISAAVGMMFSNPAVNALSHLGIAGGGVWGLLGLLKLFASQYLFWLMWASALLITAYIVFRWRGASVTRCREWLKSLKKTRKSGVGSTEEDSSLRT